MERLDGKTPVPPSKGRVIRRQSSPSLPREVSPGCFLLPRVPLFLGPRGFSWIEAGSMHRGAGSATLFITQPTCLPALLPPSLLSLVFPLLSVLCVPRVSGSPGTLSHAAEIPRSPGAPPARLDKQRGPGSPCAPCAHLHGWRGTGGSPRSPQVLLSGWRGEAAAHDPPAHAPPAQHLGWNGGQEELRALPSTQRRTGGTEQRGTKFPGRLEAWGKPLREKAGGTPCTPRAL